MITSIILTILFILGDAGVLFMSQASFGKIPQGKRLERIKQSPNYDVKKKQFVNAEETELMTGNKSTLTVWREFMFNKKKNTVPDTAIHAIKTDVSDLLSLPQCCRDIFAYLMAESPYSVFREISW